MSIITTTLFYDCTNSKNKFFVLMKTCVLPLVICLFPTMIQASKEMNLWNYLLGKIKTKKN